jgi:WD40 repeat protein
VAPSADNTVGLWELATGKCIRRFKGHEASVFGVAITHDGRFLASGGEDGTLRVWTLDDGGCVCVYPGPAAVGQVLVTSADKIVFSRTRSGAVGRSDAGILQVGVLQLSRSVLAGARPIVTAVRVWHFGDKDSGKWDDSLSIECPWCWRRSNVTSWAPGAVACPWQDCGRPLEISTTVCDMRASGPETVE